MPRRMLEVVQDLQECADETARLADLLAAAGAQQLDVEDGPHRFSVQLDELQLSAAQLSEAARLAREASVRIQAK